MSFKRISIDEAKAIIDQGDVTLADVRDPGAYQSAHIEHSINVSDENVADFLAGADKDKPIIVYCYHGNMSQGAADYFFSKGVAEVYSVDGGFEEWRLKY